MNNLKPLADIRVLAIESYGAGPWATLQLADLGAEIIKIEPPSGDVSRYVPPGAKDGDSLFYQCLNRNKKSICLDLRSQKGIEARFVFQIRGCKFVLGHVSRIKISSCWFITNAGQEGLIIIQSIP